MIKITITEKLWDGVRPGSVTKTGLSEKIRDFAKISGKAFDTPKAFDDVIAAVKTLGEAIDKAAEATKKAKDDKKGAAAKLKGWASECDDALKDLAAQRTQAGILKEVNESDQKLKILADEVEAAIKDGGELIKELGAGTARDLKAAATRLQVMRDAMRTGLKATQKDGFIDFIRTHDAVLKWGINPADVPMPPMAKTIKARLPVLQDVAERARIATEALSGKEAANIDPKADGLIDEVLAGYRDISANIKRMLPAGKNLNAQAHTAAEKFKDLIAKGVTHDKLLPILEEIHNKVMKLDEAGVKETARNRVKSGDVQTKVLKVTAMLDGPKKIEFSKLCGKEWALVMVTFRELSEQVAEAHRQVDRVLRLISATSEEAAAACSRLTKVIAEHDRELKARFM